MVSLLFGCFSVPAAGLGCGDRVRKRQNSQEATSCTYIVLWQNVCNLKQVISEAITEQTQQTAQCHRHCENLGPPQGPWKDRTGHGGHPEEVKFVLIFTSQCYQVPCIFVFAITVDRMQPPS